MSEKKECPFIPLGNALVLKRLVVEKSKGGIIMPHEESIRLSEGRVIAKGPNCHRVDIDDLVLFGKEANADIVRGGETYTFIYESGVISKISNLDEETYIKKEV